MSKTKLIVIFVILLIITGVIIFITSFSKNLIVIKNTVTLNPEPGTIITIGEQYKDEIAIKKEIASTKTLKEIKLVSGTYIVKFVGSSDYQVEYKQIYINKPTEIKTPNLKYTYEKLNQLLIAQKPAIQNVITPILPNPGYQIDKEALFENGEWYGARLIPSGWYASLPSSNILPGLINETNTEDMLRVILKNNNGQWKIMAAPSIIFAIADYPDIPQNVIRATNKLGFN